jgi:hypothetical protein
MPFRDSPVLGPPASSPAIDANDEIGAPQGVLCANFVTFSPQPGCGAGASRIGDGGGVRVVGLDTARPAWYISRVLTPRQPVGPLR